MSRRLALTALAASCSAMSHAQPASFPNRPVTLVVPFAAGGGTDSLARDLGKALERELGKPVVIDNRGGAGGAIAASAIAKAPADGHQLLFVTSTFVSHAASDPATPYDVRRDFAPVAMLGRGPLLLVASNDSGLTSVQQLISKARQQPQGLSYCSAGPGSINHVSAELFSQLAGIDMTHVPYRGSGPAVLDLLAGRTQVFFSTFPTILQQVKAGRVRVLAVTGATRSSLFPDVPTVIESGVKGFDVGTWWGIVAPPGTPAAIVQRLNSAITAAAPAIRDRLVDEGGQPLQGSPADFGQLMGNELAQWKKVLKTTGTTVN